MGFRFTENLSGSLNLTGSITLVDGQLLGSSSHATTSSYAVIAQTTVQGGISSSYALTASYADSVQASKITGTPFTKAQLPTAVAYEDEANVFTTGQTITGSLLVSGNINATGYHITASALKGDGSQITGVISSSYAVSSSYALIAQNVLGSITSASYALTSSYAFNAATASYFSGNLALPNGLDVSGSVVITGSLNVIGAGITGSLKGDGSQVTGIVSSSYAVTSSYASVAQNVLGSITSASYALSASHAQIAVTAGSSTTATSASYANSVEASHITGTPFTKAQVPSAVAYEDEANVFTSNQTITGSLFVSGNIDNTGYAHTASAFKGEGSQVTGIISSSYATTSSYALVAQNVLGSITSASFATTASAATSITFVPVTSSYAVTASAATSITFTPATASFAVTASYASNFIPSGAFTGTFARPIRTEITTPPTPYTMSVSDTYLIGDTRSGSFTILLPDVTTSVSQWITIVKPYATASLTILASGSALINSSASITLNLATSSVELRNRGPIWIVENGTGDGSNWMQIQTASYTYTVPAAGVIGTVTSASFAQNSLTANSATTATSASFATTASAATSITFVPVTSSFATTASYGNSVEASHITGTPFTKAQLPTAVAYEDEANVFTASQTITGSLLVSGNIDNTGYAHTASAFKGDGSQITGIVSASYANSVEASKITGTPFTKAQLPAAVAYEDEANVFTTNQTITGSLLVSGNINATGYSVTASAFKGDGSQITGVISSSYALSASFAPGSGPTISASYATTSSYALVAQSVLGSITSASWAAVAVTASYFSGTADFIGGLIVTGSVRVSGNIDNTGYHISASAFKGDGSQITGVVSASYALSASWAPGGGPAVSASYALTASFASNIIPSGAFTGTFARPILNWVGTNPYTASVFDTFIIGDTRSGSFTILLPDLTSSINQWLTIIKPHATASLTILASGSALINSSASVVLTLATSSVELNNNGDRWYVLGGSGDGTNWLQIQTASFANNVVGSGVNGQVASALSSSYALSSSWAPTPPAGVQGTGTGGTVTIWNDSTTLGNSALTQADGRVLVSSSVSVTGDVTSSVGYLVSSSTGLTRFLTSIEAAHMFIPTQSLGTLSSNVTASLNLHMGQFFTAQAAAAANIRWEVLNANTTGLDGFMIRISSGGLATHTWPVGTAWPGGSPPTLTPSGGFDVLTFVSNASSSWHAVVAHRNSR